MAYEWKYLPKSSKELGAEAEGMLQRLDTMLFELQQEKGDFYTKTCAFLVEVKLFNVTLPDAKSLINSRFIGKYVVQVLTDKFGKDETERKLEELMSDCERICNKALLVETAKP